MSGVRTSRTLPGRPKKFFSKPLDKQGKMCYNVYCEVREMAKKLDRRAFKKEGEELQQYLMFQRRGSKVESKKRYDRKKFKKIENFS